MGLSAFLDEMVADLKGPMLVGGRPVSLEFLKAVATMPPVGTVVQKRRACGVTFARDLLMGAVKPDVVIYHPKRA